MQSVTQSFGSGTVSDFLFSKSGEQYVTRSFRILDRVENGRRNKMFPDVLVISLAVGSARRDKATTYAALPPQAHTRSFPYSQSSKAISLARNKCKNSFLVGELVGIFPKPFRCATCGTAVVNR